jgi:hypothetical protein
MLKKFLLTLSLTTLLIAPAQKAEAGIILVGTGVTLAATGNSEGLGAVALGGFFAGMMIVPFVAAATGPIAWIVLEEKLENTDGIATKLSKLYPEINDYSVAQELADEIFNEYLANKDDSGVTNIKLSKELTRSILERSDLTPSQIEKIATDLN